MRAEQQVYFLQSELSQVWELTSIFPVWASFRTSTYVRARTSHRASSAADPNFYDGSVFPVSSSESARFPRPGVKLLPRWERGNRNKLLTATPSEPVTWNCKIVKEIEKKNPRRRKKSSLLRVEKWKKKIESERIREIERCPDFATPKNIPNDCGRPRGLRLRFDLDLDLEDVWPRRHQPHPLRPGGPGPSGRLGHAHGVWGRHPNSEYRHGVTFPYWKMNRAWDVFALVLSMTSH